MYLRHTDNKNLKWEWVQQNTWYHKQCEDYCYISPKGGDRRALPPANLQVCCQKDPALTHEHKRQRFQFLPPHRWSHSCSAPGHSGGWGDLDHGKQNTFFVSLVLLWHMQPPGTKSKAMMGPKGSEFSVETPNTKHATVCFKKQTRRRWKSRGSPPAACHPPDRPSSRHLKTRSTCCFAVEDKGVLQSLKPSQFVKIISLKYCSCSMSPTKMTFDQSGAKQVLSFFSKKNMKSQQGRKTDS